MSNVKRVVFDKKEATRVLGEAACDSRGKLRLRTELDLAETAKSPTIRVGNHF